MSAHQSDEAPSQDGTTMTKEEEHRHRVAEMRAKLAQDFSIDTTYVGVPKLSRILGIAPSTIYGYMRQGQFFMPYRIINTTAMIALDDIAEWHCSTDGVVPPAPRARSERAPAQAEGAAPTALGISDQKRPPTSANQLVEETLREMGLPRARGPR
jgi:predicted DNA-binding transcriptional regulator AlpA